MKEYRIYTLWINGYTVAFLVLIVALVMFAVFGLWALFGAGGVLMLECGLAIIVLLELQKSSQWKDGDYRIAHYTVKIEQYKRNIKDFEKKLKYENDNKIEKSKKME